jgi:hypothetical protein
LATIRKPQVEVDLRFRLRCRLQCGARLHAMRVGRGCIHGVPCAHVQPVYRC